MAEEISSPSPNEGALDGGTPPVVAGFSAAATITTEKEKWFIEMRGWIMVLAVQVASFTYQAGLNPPCHFSEPEPKSTDSFRHKVFFYSNTTAFLTSLAIIILLMNWSFYRSLTKVTVLEIIVVLDMIGLMAAYWAGSTGKNQTNMFIALVLTALVLFVIHVVYTVRLVQKLHKVWRHMPVPPPTRATTRDDDDCTSPPVPKQQGIDGTVRVPPTMDVGLSKSEMRRRDSPLVARTPRTEKSTMLSP